jgi:hypothetical protein
MKPSPSGQQQLSQAKWFARAGLAMVLAFCSLSEFDSFKHLEIFAFAAQITR